MRAAGAIVLGKTAADDFAYHGNGTSSLTGQVRNPYDPLRRENARRIERRVGGRRLRAALRSPRSAPMTADPIAFRRSSVESWE